jgi:hypothetical protein
VHVVRVAVHELGDDDAVCPLRGVERVPEREHVAVVAHVRRRRAQPDPVVRALAAARHLHVREPCKKKPTIVSPIAPFGFPMHVWKKTIAFGLGTASASLTEVLRVCEVVEVHAVGVGGDEDVGADGAVEAAHHVHHLRVEEVHGARQLRRALAVLAVQRQLGRDAPQRPRPRHDHAPRAQLVQPLHTNACSTARSVACYTCCRRPRSEPYGSHVLVVIRHSCKSRRLCLSVRRCMHGMVLVADGGRSPR